MQDKTNEQQWYSVTVNDTELIGFPSLLALSICHFTIVRVDGFHALTFGLEDPISRGGTRLNTEVVKEKV